MTRSPARALPLQDLSIVDRLGDDLRHAGYSADSVPDLLGESAHRALGRGEFWPALRASSDGSPLATCIRLFLLGTTESDAAVRAALPATGVRAAVVNGVLEPDDDGFRAGLDIRPHADDDADYLVVSDLDSDTRPGPVHPDHVLGVGAASVSLARAVIRRPAATALDLGTGCGVQALHLSSHVGRITATDTNPRALALAGATARLNGQRWDLRQGSLFEPVIGDRFDLVVSNPPFVVGAGDRRYEYRDSGVVGDGICEQLIRAVADHLNPEGTAQLLANWMVIGEQDWRERVGAWVSATGCDAWVVQREIADPAEYVSLWLADAGEARERAVELGSAWLDWFAAQGVTGIGMGVVTLRRTDRAAPDVVLDQITAAGEEVTGAEADAFLARRRWESSTSDTDLLGARLALASSVILEERSLAGHEGWAPVLRMLRRPGGPGATVQVDEWGRALLAGCTGVLPLGALVDLLAAAHGLDPQALAAAVLPAVRVAISRGLLHPTQEGA